MLDWVENRDFRGMIIGNEGKNFSVGANLAEMATVVMEGRYDIIEPLIARFQTLAQRIYYATKPIVVALHGQILGGGCELAMASPQIVAAAESYMGLVELGVGLIPAGGGLMRLAAMAADSAATERPVHIQPFLQQAFETVAQAKVFNSAIEAQDFGFISPKARIVMNADRRLYVAKKEVIRLSEEGYLPPPDRHLLMVLGRSAQAQFEQMAYHFRQGGFITEYDCYLVKRLASVMTGGDLSAPTRVHENYLLELERETFMSLLGEKKTQERIASILTTKKPLRN
jgi:3-hydroxyacyl-CoA dehydrogenase